MKHKLNTAFCLAAFVVLAALSFYYPVPWWAFLLPLMLWITVAGLGSAFIASNYHVKALCKGTTTAKETAITFDDGPHPETEKVLDLLKQYEAKGTFFCIGSQIEKHPRIFKRIISEGHTVGNHSYSHSTSFGFFNTQKVLDEIQLTDVSIEKNTGKKAKLFRPPFGVTTPSIAGALKVSGHNTMGWNIRSLDTVIDDEEKILERIKKRLAPGSIILLHDTSTKTVRVLEQLLIFLKEKNYEAITADRLLNIAAYEE